MLHSQNTDRFFIWNIFQVYGRQFAVPYSRKKKLRIFDLAAAIEITTNSVWIGGGPAERRRVSPDELRAGLRDSLIRAISKSCSTPGNHPRRQPRIAFTKLNTI